MLINDGQINNQSFVSKQTPQSIVQLNLRESAVTQAVQQFNAKIKKVNSLKKIKKMKSDNWQQLEKLAQIEDKRWIDYMNTYRQLSDKSQRLYLTKVKVLSDQIKLHQSIINQAKIKSAKDIQYYEKLIVDEEKRQSKIIFYLRGIIGLAGSIIIGFLFGGAFNRWSTINKFITGYYKLTNDPFPTSIMNMIGGPIGMLAASIGMLRSLDYSKYFEDRIKLGRIIFLALITILSGLSCLIASYMPSFLLFVFFNNFLYGLFAGAILLNTLDQLQKYFMGYELLITSLVEVGSGFGGLYFNNINTKCLNPLGVAPNYKQLFTGVVDYVSYSVPQCMRETSYYMWAVGAVGCLLMIPMNLHNTKASITQIRIQYRQAKSYQNQCYSEREALTDRITWTIGLIYILCSMGNFFFNMHYEWVPKKTIHNGDYFSTISNLGLVFYGVFRIFWGVILQKFRYKIAFIVAMVLNIFSFSMAFIAINSYEFYGLVFVISEGITGSLMILISYLCLVVYGDYGNVMIGYMWGFFTFSNFLQYFLSTLLLEIIDEIYVLWIFALTTLVGLVMGSIVSYQGKWQNNLENLGF